MREKLKVVTRHQVITDQKIYQNCKTRQEKNILQKNLLHSRRKRETKKAREREEEREGERGQKKVNVSTYFFWLKCCYGTQKSVPLFLRILRD